MEDGGKNDDGDSHQKRVTQGKKLTKTKKKRIEQNKLNVGKI